MTSSSGEKSLRLGFDEARTRVVLRTTELFQQELVQLVARFRTGGQLGPLSASVSLDELLADLGLLGTWSDPTGVEWADDLRGLVSGVVQDAHAVQQRLAGRQTADEVAPDDVPALLGDTWKGELSEFQRRDIAKLLSLQHGANFSVPGAGKTRVALAVYAAQKEARRVSRLLVVCPKSAYESWRYETAECLIHPLRINVLDGSLDQWAEVLVVNYERLDRSLSMLAGWLKSAPSMIILDEAHRMKLGARGTYGAACMALGPLAARRLILTGTPAPNGSRDLENLLGFVWPGHGQRTVVQAVAGGDLAHASTVLQPLFTRTTKHELGLPPVQLGLRFVDMPPLHDEIYTAIVGGERSGAAREDLSAHGKTALRLLMAATSPALLLEGGSRYEPLAYQLPPMEIPEGGSLYSLMQNLPDYELSPKYKEAVAIIAENAAQGRKTLVWTTFVRSLTTLERMLEKYSPAVVYGGTPDREEQIRRFREDPACMVLISNPATLGEGISLHHVCHDAVYVDRDFMAGRFLQSLDRIHRLGLAPGTETRVTVLAVRNSVDEVVAASLERKLEFMGRILDDPTVQQLADLEEEPSVAAGLAPGDIEALLSHMGGR
ncbi:DNA helicase [Streptomyces anthocyanicus]|uniref:DEAD/DEAH box helicase n=1 Tax=Streptomyces TaxID=1883 RepID=UPI0004CBA158|nr:MULTISPECIES: DEAD/DEAH box helicase [Streptomyces]MDX3317229.1 DEAD/DEAH box helicase [Streptomyces sp. ME03-5684b]MDX3368634.1 DEAD/DEAH box helicase [Streptomyces sp. ME02-6987-2C]MDX3424680.1 DEAD/DEAH box helicase [Streptomyces sp. ME02-6985-2c]WTC50772.1 DEAD/DEAH box helicase [Streptomyces anthocyanicus]GGL28848.1 DNA helicase [Streptomyces anthocyanicus]